MSEPVVEDAGQTEVPDQTTCTGKLRWLLLPMLLLQLLCMSEVSEPVVKDVGQTKAPDQMTRTDRLCEPLLRLMLPL
eukprot:COSAG01_NODE_19612_length_1000_cov_1.581576_1_plen_77_part_00